MCLTRCAVLARPVPKEREERERAELQCSWEMAAVLDFLNLFRRELGLSSSFSWDELENALILSPGDQGLLCWLHIVRPAFPQLQSVDCAPHVAHTYP